MKRASESSGAGGSSAAQRPRVDPAGSSSLPSSSLGKSGDAAPPIHDRLGEKSVDAASPAHDTLGGKSLGAALPAHVGLEGLGDVLDVVASTTRQVKQYHASLAPRPGVEQVQETEALVSSADMLKFLETRRAGRQSVQTLIDELQRLKSESLQNFEAEITVLNTNGAPLLNKKEFSLPDHGLCPLDLEHDGPVCPGCGLDLDDLEHNPTVESVLDAIWERVDGIVAKCHGEELLLGEFRRGGHPNVWYGDERQGRVRDAFLERLEKNTNPDMGLAPLVKYRLDSRYPITDPSFSWDFTDPSFSWEKRKGIMLVPDGGDPAAAERCHPDDRLLALLTSKNADGSARGGWKWLGPGRVEMQFHAMILEELLYP